jgi:hypothetical protein
MTRLFVFLLCAVSFAQPPATKPQTPEAVIDSFYRWYVHEIDSNKDPMKTERRTLSTYATQRLLGDLYKKMARNELDFDYFLQAQDLEKSWGTNIQVSKVQVTDPKATLSVRLGKGPEIMPLNITMRKEAGAWKIDTIERVH